MKKLLSLLVATSLMFSAYAQQSTCGSTSPNILSTPTPISLCDGVSTDDLEINLSSNLPNTEFFIVNIDQMADDGLGDAIVGVDADGIFFPTEMNLGYDQRFAVRPFAYDIDAFRQLVNVIFSNNSSGTSCCAHAEQIAKDFCETLQLADIDDPQNINDLSDVLTILQASSGGTENSFSITGFLMQIDLLKSLTQLLPEACRQPIDYCYAVGNEEQIFEIMEVPYIEEVDVNMPYQITINSSISQGTLEYSIDPSNGWQQSNLIKEAPAEGIAYVREVTSNCVEQRAYVNTTLPIELEEFEGTPEITTNLLYWRTLTEINSLSFSLMRSSDGINFSEIGSIDAAGTSLSPTDYVFRDESPLVGFSYYQLEMEDYSGHIDQSDVIDVQRDDSSGFSILSIGPNPSANNINISIINDATEQIDYFVYDLAGRKVRTGTQNLVEGINNFSIDAAIMGTGMYIFTAAKGNYVISAYKFVMH